MKGKLLRKQLKLVIYKEEDYEYKTCGESILTCVYEIPENIDNDEEFIKYLYFRFAKELEKESSKRQEKDEKTLIGLE